MKYFISNKESAHLNFNRLTIDQLESLDHSIDEELVIYPGTLEGIKDTTDLLKIIRTKCSKGCKIVFQYINIYQLFNDVAFHRLDVGVGHLTCKSIERPYNVVAATNELRKAGFTILRTSLEDESRFIRMECVNE